MNEPPKPDAPQDPFSALTDMAVQAHELFLAHIQAGFTESQALYLVACVVTGGPKAAP